MSVGGVVDGEGLREELSAKLRQMRHSRQSFSQAWCMMAASSVSTFSSLLPIQEGALQPVHQRGYAKPKECQQEE